MRSPFWWKCEAVHLILNKKTILSAFICNKCDNEQLRYEQHWSWLGKLFGKLISNKLVQKIQRQSIFSFNSHPKSCGTVWNLLSIRV